MSTIKIDWYENPVGPGQKPKKRLHARVVSYSNVKSDEVIRRIQMRSSLSEGDVKSALTLLSEVLGECLAEGRRVQLEGLGYFTPTLSTMEPVKADTKRKGGKVKLKTVRFRPDKVLMGNIDSEAHFIQTDIPNRSSKLSEREIDLRLKEYFSTHKYITRRVFQRECDVVRSTAAMQLRRLREAGKLVNVGTRNQPLYIPGRGFYGRSVQGEYEL
jgi:predicted histone-like DNA-binding protein